MALEKSGDDFKEEYIKDLINFGLTHEEGMVYLSLLKRGNRGEVVGRIKDELNIGRTTIYAIMERLKEKGWVIAEEISTQPRRVKYTAKTPLSLLNQIIEKKEKELKILKHSSLLIGDKLEKAYQGAKNLNINTIHVGGYRYLKPLAESGWKILSEVVEHVDSQDKLTLDYELKGKKGIPKECGLIIFKYDKNIEKDEILIAEALEMLKTKSEHEIRKDKIPGFQDVILEDTKFNGYQGVNVYIKLKIKKKPWLAGKEAVIPIKNRIFLIHGNKENFQILMEIILNSERFQYLV
ncbi:MAG: helix-turn-helix domain-containing protein [Candidatus Hermodarchaeota archaeon]